MKLPDPLIKGKILKRYKRFLADVELENGEIITAHTANTGSMKTCWEPGWEVLLSYHDNPKRKLKYSLEMAHNGKTWIGINTSLPNKIAQEAIKNGTIQELQGYRELKPEIKIDQARLDILLHDGEVAGQPNVFKNPCYVEIKNVTLLGDNAVSLFPDAVSTRGQKHLKQLIQLVKSGARGVMLYVINRQDVQAFAPAQEIDPDYARLLSEAQATGVEVLAYQCQLTPREITLRQPLPVSLS